jgi:hypothetical protein
MMKTLALSAALAAMTLAMPAQADVMSTHSEASKMGDKWLPQRDNSNQTDNERNALQILFLVSFADRHCRGSVDIRKAKAAIEDMLGEGDHTYMELFATRRVMYTTVTKQREMLKKHGQRAMCRLANEWYGPDGELVEGLISGHSD